jgi:hypothetical protein
MGLCVCHPSNVAEGERRWLRSTLAWQAKANISVRQTEIVVEDPVAARYTSAYIA